MFLYVSFLSNVFIIVTYFKVKVYFKDRMLLLNDVLCSIEGLVEDNNFFEDEYSVEDAELSVSVVHSSTNLC